jgi:hypothetical protein
VIVDMISNVQGGQLMTLQHITRPTMSADAKFSEMAASNMARLAARQVRPPPHAPTCCARAAAAASAAPAPAQATALLRPRQGHALHAPHPQAQLRGAASRLRRGGQALRLHGRREELFYGQLVALLRFWKVGRCACAPGPRRPAAQRGWPQPAACGPRR